MNVVKVLLETISSFIILYINILCYEKLSNKKICINFKSILVTILIVFTTTYNTYYSDNYIKLLISVLSLIINNKVLFNEDLKTTSIRTISCYIIVVIFELILSFSLFFLPIKNINQINDITVYKLLCSLIIMIPTYIICCQKWMALFVDNIIKRIFKYKSALLYLIITLILIVALAYNFYITFTDRTYFINMSILVCFICLLILSVSISYKARKAEEKQEVLLNFMSKYEKMIDEGRINRHEMLNNLLILKSFKNKNTKSYNTLLEELITTYTSSESVKNIYNLPSGLKGVIYYKINDMKNMGISVNTHISNDFSLKCDKLSSQNYISLCKIAAIILDNAKDAASVSKEKIISIDMYKEKDLFCFSVSNSFDGEIDLDKINIVEYSTKGKGRGLGLYVANSIAKKHKNINLNQEINNKIFTSIITIK